MGKGLTGPFSYSENHLESGEIRVNMLTRRSLFVPPCRASALPHVENGNIFLEMSSHYRQVSRYNTRSSFLLVSADKIGGREIIALIGNKTLIRGESD